jgi:hypothetical protein
MERTSRFGRAVPITGTYDSEIDVVAFAVLELAAVPPLLAAAAVLRTMRGRRQSGGHRRGSA